MIPALKYNRSFTIIGAFLGAYRSRSLIQEVYERVISTYAIAYLQAPSEFLYNKNYAMTSLRESRGYDWYFSIASRPIRNDLLKIQWRV